MTAIPHFDLQTRLGTLEHAGPERVTRAVDLILSDAAGRAASDVHAANMRHS